MPLNPTHWSFKAVSRPFYRDRSLLDFIYRVSAQQQQSISVDRLCFVSDVCTSHFTRLWHQFGEKISTQTWTWEQQLHHSTLFQFLLTKEEEIRTGVLHCSTMCINDIITHHYSYYFDIFCFVFCRIFRPQGPQKHFV